VFCAVAIWYRFWGPADAIPAVLAVTPAEAQASTVVGTPQAAKPFFGPMPLKPKPLAQIVEMPQSYTLPISYGQLGPALVKAGVIDLPSFLRVLESSDNAHMPELKAIMTTGSDQPVTMNAANAHFLLNFFWAVGLANRNPILLEGPIQQHGAGKADQFASTGGWTLATKPVTEIMASLPLIELNAEQQKRLETVAAAVYRPCCGNSTLFPDCNHGMAMLAILELMAVQDASEDEMFEAAKYANAFWFPQQMAEAAAYLKLAENVEFAAAGARRIVGHDMFSATGIQTVHQWLAEHGHFAQPGGGGNVCGL
jgi:hypothetical protein